MSERPEQREPADVGAAQRPGGLVNLGPWSRAEVERALGAPLMTADPVLTTRQAAALLGCTMNRLQYLRRVGRAKPTGRRHRRWRLADLAEVQHQPSPAERPAEQVHVGRIPTDEAAALLDVPRRTLRRWITEGKLPAVRDSRGRWWTRPDDLDPLRPGGANPVHDGRVPSAEAAAILGIPAGAYREAAAAGKVPAVKDSAGRWWARPDHLETIRRAREIEAAYDRPNAPLG